MDPNELLKAAPEIQKIVAIIVGGFPAGEIVKSILVPPAAVLGKRMADRVERLFDKTGKMIQDTGVTPQTVSDKLLIDILRGASVEDNEDLHTMWAALLANAASPDAVRVRSIFVGILRQLSKDEAQLLNWAFDRMLSDRSSRLASDPYPAMFPRTDVLAAYDALCGTTPGGSASSLDRQTCLDSLEAAQLLPRRFDVINIGGEQYYSLSALGYQFVEACRPPKPKENG